MKKILYFVLSIVTFCNIAFADESLNSLNAAVLNTNMPSDEEIMSTIEKFDFSQEQKQQLFKETKKQLELMYSTKDENSALKNQTLPEVQKTDRNLQIEEPRLKERPKN